MRRLVAPRWIAGHLLVVVAVIAFLSLGFWQLRRLDEKRAFNAEVAAGLDSPPIDAMGAIADGTVYRRIAVEGTFDVEFEALVLRSRAGVSGYHVLTPFVLGDGSALIVDRGWVPISYDEAPVAAAPPPSGTTVAAGLLWPAQAGSGSSDGLPDVVRRIDPELWEGVVPYPLAPQYLVLTEGDGADGGLPMAAPPPQLPEGPHLGYAVQWFLFTAVVMVGYPLLLVRVVRRSDASG